MQDNVPIRKMRQGTLCYTIHVKHPDILKNKSDFPIRKFAPISAGLLTCCLREKSCLN